MTIDELMAEWAIDATIDQLDLENELIKIPKLHAKYLAIMSKHTLIEKKLATDYAKMKRLKWDYYSGDLNNPQDLKEHNLEPFSKKVLRTDIPTYLESDEDLSKILLRRAVHQEMIDACELILKELHSRTFQLKTYVEYLRFTSAS